MPTRSYDLHGLLLTVTAWDELSAAIHARLERLPAGEEGGLPGGELRFEYAAVESAAAPAPPPRSRVVYEPPGGRVLYDPGEDLLYLEMGPRLRAISLPAAGCVRVFAPRPEPGDLWLLSHPFFTLPLAEMAKRRGLYALHAAGACLDRRGIALPGTSGAGKSTLAVALARAGLSFLGDDTLFLARRPQGLRLLAFPDEIDLTDGSAALFPELAPRLTAPGLPGWRKRQLRADGLGEAAPAVRECAPAVLVFPRVAGRAESVLAPATAGEALLELAPNVLLTEPRSTQAHLDALAALAAASACYRLETGSDLAAVAGRLRRLLQPSLEPSLEPPPGAP